MKICKICGTENLNTDRHCQKCGSPLIFKEEETLELFHRTGHQLLWYSILIVSFLFIFLFVIFAPGYFSQNIELSVTDISIKQSPDQILLEAGMDLNNKNPFDVNLDSLAYDVDFLNKDRGEYEYIGSGSIADENLKGNSITHLTLPLTTSLAHADFGNYSAVNVQVIEKGQVTFFNVGKSPISFETNQTTSIISNN